MKPSTSRVLARLVMADGQWISGNELARAVGWRYGARVYELRQLGYTIERRSAPNGSPVDEYRIVPLAEQQSMDLSA
jgi:biotin operon repressor